MFLHNQNGELEENNDIIDMRIGPEVSHLMRSKIDSSLLGAAAAPIPCSSSQAKALYNAESEDVTEDDVRLWQEQKDEVCEQFFKMFN